MPLLNTSPEGDSAHPLDVSDFDLRLERYRIAQPKADSLMVRSLSKYGQLAPLVYCILDGALVLVDGFKRLRAARTLKGMNVLGARRLDVDERSAKAAIFNLNRITSRPNELEESWIIYALVHDDGLEQVEVAQMLGRHKSWVNRRLALIERLTDEARQSLRLGLLTPTQARHLTQLPRGNQNAAMQCASEHALSSRELSQAVQLLQSASTREQTQFVLEKPREAIRQSQDSYVHQWDPRLSTAGNRFARRLGMLLDATTKMNHWLRFTGRSELQACDRPVLVPGITKLGEESALLSESINDFVKELILP
ncbi:MAG: ParB/RepB/Spo0J family partition protein [Vibrio fluvialis]